MMLPLLTLRQFTSPVEVTAELRSALAACWIEVTNGGAAVGFALPRIDERHAVPVVERLVGSLDPDTSRFVTVFEGERLAGWLNVRRDPADFIAHWGTVHHVQTTPAARGRGVGRALMSEVRRVARDEMALEQLHLTARGGSGLEEFYGHLGWKEVGRWPGAHRPHAGFGRRRRSQRRTPSPKRARRPLPSAACA